MPRCLQIFIGVAALGFLLPSLSMAMNPHGSQRNVNPVVQAELIRIEAKRFTVKEVTGRERELKIDRETARVGALRQGVYVQAGCYRTGELNQSWHSVNTKIRNGSFPHNPDIISLRRCETFEKSFEILRLIQKLRAYLDESLNLFFFE